MKNRLNIADNFVKNGGYHSENREQPLEENRRESRFLKNKNFLPSILNKSQRKTKTNESDDDIGPLLA